MGRRARGARGATARAEAGAGTSGQVRLPVRFGAAEREPESVGGRERLAGQPHAGLGQQVVLLLRVASTAGGDDVLPDVLSAAGAGDHVIEVLRRRRAVLARPAVAGE